MYFPISESNGCLDLGYKSFMHGVYGDNVIFTNGKFYHITYLKIFAEHYSASSCFFLFVLLIILGDETEVLRNILQNLFTAERLEQFQDIIGR